MTTMTLSTAPPAIGPATRRRRSRPNRPQPQPSTVRGCAGAETRSSAAWAVDVVPALVRPGVPPLHTAPARLTRRGRIALALGFVTVLGGGLVAGQATVGTPSTPISYGVVTVQPGQTLWGIAHEVAPGADPRTTVERLVAVNGLVDADAITAGDQLSVPLGR